MLKTIVRYRANVVGILLSALVISACETLPGLERRPTQPPGVQAAIDLSEQGDHDAASQQYVQLANSASGPQRQRYFLFAARELYLGNDLFGAEELIKTAGSPVDNSNLPLWAEVVASIRLAQQEPAAALEALNRVTETTDRKMAARILKLRATALFELDRLQAAVATLVRREALLRNRDDIYANHQFIWTNLERSAKPIENQSIQSATDPIVAGWLELGQIAERERGSIGQLKAQFLQWQQTHPDHPANANLIPDLLDQLSALSNYPANVALLLPLSGKQKLIGEAIRDGYLTALYSLTETNARPVIRFYDTAISSATDAYNLAVSNGAVFVVGPLLKDNVISIASQMGDVTTLALNFATGEAEAPANLYQFALAPEDEARAVARRAVAEGWNNAVALVPDNTWGQRVFQAFQRELQSQGGQVLTAKAYPGDTPDYSPVIRNVLLLDESESRRDRLAANLGKQLEYEPRRRDDVDFIFMAANAPTAKLLRPQLRFHYASNLPTFATSAAYMPGSDNNAELNGIIFPDAPWLINPTSAVIEHQESLQQLWGTTVQRRARFFALGYDAYQLTALLNGRSGRFEINLEGMTGDIFMDQNGYLRRELDFARIKNGEPQLLDDPAEVKAELTQPAPSRSPITIITP